MLQNAGAGLTYQAKRVIIHNRNDLLYDGVGFDGFQRHCAGDRARKETKTYVGAQNDFALRHRRRACHTFRAYGECPACCV